MSGWQTSRKLGRRPPMSHLIITWKTVEPMTEYSRPMMPLLMSQKERTLIWQSRMERMGTPMPRAVAA